MLKHILLIFIALPTFATAQNTYFFGVDLGPKFDIYKLATGGNHPYQPNFNLKNDVGAFFGVNGGVLVEDKIMLEAGFYKSNFKAVFNLINEDGKTYFNNTPVNTFTTILFPVNFYVRRPITKQEGVFIHFGGGFSTLIGTKLGIEDVYYSPSEALDPEDLSKGSIAYTILDNDFDANIITLNLNVAFHYPVNQDVAASITFASRFGVAGNNYVDFEHFTPDYPKVTNTIFTSGTGFQLQFGFRYFLRE